MKSTSRKARVAGEPENIAYARRIGEVNVGGTAACRCLPNS